jgi:integrase
MLSAAVEDSVVPANPAAGVLRSMHLKRSLRASQERVRAMNAEQLERFLAASETRTPALHSLFFLLSRTGLRLGEAVALAWDDIDLERRELRVERAVGTDGRIDTPKSGHGRTVDLSRAACEMLRSLRARAAEEGLAQGEARRRYVFHAQDVDAPMPHVTAEKGFKRAFAAAGLAGDFSPHSLRHTYASLLLQRGESPAYVQEQLGHASIELTVGTDGRWLRKRPTVGADGLDSDRSGSKKAEVVARWEARKGTLGRPSPAISFVYRLAERGGFEPPVQALYPYNRLAIVFRACFRRVQELSWRFADFDLDQY